MNEKLQQARINKGLTQLEVAEKANISVRSYQRIEKGMREPKISTAKLIAKALNSTVEKLF